ncbi:MAG: transcriptional repressor, partial [Clostridiales bacterium]|nr:transcriptional repressor [Clostridiales bacterium]
MKQQRNTRQRQLVLDAVRSRRDHPTADQIYQSVHAVD